MCLCIVDLQRSFHQIPAASAAAALSTTNTTGTDAEGQCSSELLFDNLESVQEKNTDQVNEKETSSSTWANIFADRKAAKFRAP